MNKDLRNQLAEKFQILEQDLKSAEKLKDYEEALLLIVNESSWPLAKSMAQKVLEKYGASND